MDDFERRVHSQIRKAAYDIEKIADYVIGANNPGLSNVLYSAAGQVREYAQEYKDTHTLPVQTATPEQIERSRAIVKEAKRAIREREAEQTRTLVQAVWERRD